MNPKDLIGKHRELAKVYHKLMMIKTSAELWDNLPIKSKQAIDKACESALVALKEYECFVRQEPTD